MMSSLESKWFVFEEDITIIYARILWIEILGSRKAIIFFENLALLDQG